MPDLQLERDERSWIGSLLRAAERQQAFSVVVLGSVARATRTSMWSDLDVLVVDAAAPDAPPTVHVLEIKQSQLKQQVLEGDDVSQWALRFGKPIHGAKRWKSFAAELLKSAPWPAADRKLAQAKARIRVAQALSSVGDETSAQKEAIYAASHLCRALLLALGEFPLSRPELGAQLTHLGQANAAHVLRRLCAPRPLANFERDLDWVRKKVDKTLSELDARHSSDIASTS